FIVLDSTRSIVRVAQAAARFLYVESCNQCPACKHGLRIASHTLDGMFDPEQSHVHSVELALFGARSAPQANRCYLPVEGSVLISSLVHKFKQEFDDQLSNPRQNTESFASPLIVDIDDVNHRFIYDSTITFKNPDWTYSAPAAAIEELSSLWRRFDFRREIDELESSDSWKT